MNKSPSNEYKNIQTCTSKQSPPALHHRQSTSDLSFEINMKCIDAWTVYFFSYWFISFSIHGQCTPNYRCYFAIWHCVFLCYHQSRPSVHSSANSGGRKKIFIGKNESNGGKYLNSISIPVCVLSISFECCDLYWNIGTGKNQKPLPTTISIRMMTITRLGVRERLYRHHHQNSIYVRYL